MPPLQFLHGSLVAVKLEQFDRFPTDDLIHSLAPGQPGCLKTRPDGTILDGHHRIEILRRRGVAVDDLPRDIIKHEDPEGR